MPEWFLLIMCKEHTLKIFASPLSRNHPTWRHSIITFALREGRGRGVRENINVCEQGDRGRLSNQCERFI